MGWQTSHSMCLVLLVSCVNSNFQFHLLRLTLKYVSNICTVFLVIISLLIIYLLGWVELLLIFLFLSSLSWCAEKWSLSRSGRCLFFFVYSSKRKIRERQRWWVRRRCRCTVAGSSSSSSVRPSADRPANSVFSLRRRRRRRAAATGRTAPAARNPSPNDTCCER